MQRRRSLAQLLAALLVVPLLALLPAAPAHADAVPPTNYNPVSLSDLPLASTVVTDAAGGVTVGCPQGSSTTSFKSFNAAGTLVQNQAVGSPSGAFCTSNSTVGTDGTVYRTVSDSGTDYYVQAWKNNSLVWQYALPCAPYAYPSSMVMGANGNVYMVVEQGSCGSQRLIGLSAAAQSGTNPPVPQVVMNESISGFVQGNALAAYNDGLVLYKSGGVQYASYSGTFDTPVSPNDMVNTYTGYDWFTATTSGRVFLPIQANWASSTGCSDQSNAVGSIKAVDPDDIAWTISISSCVYVREIHPTPNNGFVMRFAYTPTTGGDPVEKVAAYDGSGSLMWAKSIQGVGWPGVQAVSADLNGNVVVRTDIAEWHTVNGSSYRFPETDVMLLDGFSGEVLKQSALRGEHDTIDGPSYMWGNGGVMSMAKNTFYVTAQECAYLGGCDSSNPTKLYAFSVPGLAMDYPRGAILGVGSGTRLPYAALGDSFSAGQGVPPFSDTSGCNRSTRAYSVLFDQGINNYDLVVPPSQSAFVACSGATTQDVRLGAVTGANQPKQIDVLSTSTKLVTITIGGNDIGFGPLAEKCVKEWDCVTSTEYSGALYKLSNVLPGALDQVYADIKAELGSTARVLVIGYPMMIPDPAINTLPLCPYLAHDEKVAARSVISQLNQAVRAAVGRAGTPFEYVDPNSAQSPFAGHELCMDGGYYNGVDIAHPEYSLHPNALGQNAYRQVLLSAM